MTADSIQTPNAAPPAIETATGPVESFDRHTLMLLGGVVAFLTLATVVGRLLGRRDLSEAQERVIANLNARINAWWVMTAVFGGVMVVGFVGSVVLFGVTSFLALREFITLAPTERGDHRTLFWAFFIITPFQYYLVAIEWYGLYSIMIPVYAFLFVPIRNVLAGQVARFLSRTAMVQWGLMIAVYLVSYAPAILTLEIPGRGGYAGNLLLFFVIVVQMSDVFQYIWGKLIGRRPVAPNISPNKTWEGLIGGIATATLIGAAMAWATPFSWRQAAFISLAIAIVGFFGGLTMSAIKRDRGVKDFGDLIPGHGGILDRIDSLCFAAPVFFHLTRYYFT
jgi:phosphatidate cytidylyltransferase